LKIEKLPPKASNFYYRWINHVTESVLGRTVKGSTIFAAFADVDFEERISGWGCIKCQRGNWYLGLTYVTEEHRGKGIQRALIDHRLEYLENLGVDVARVGVKPDNKYSIANIKKMGFELEKSKKDYDVYKLLF